MSVATQMPTNRYLDRGVLLVGDTGLEPVTSSVSESQCARSPHRGGVVARRPNTALTCGFVGKGRRTQQLCRRDRQTSSDNFRCTD